MELFTPLPPPPANSLGLALVISSPTPLLMLNADLIVEAASGSFCAAFALNCDNTTGVAIGELGAGEWSAPQLRSLLRAAVTTGTAIEAYEFDLVRIGQPTLHLVMHARKLDYADAPAVHVVLAIQDVTEVRAIEKLKDDVVREKHVLLQELQHRVANSLQIIASVLMQSARKVQSDEARSHLNDAHHRVMSIATLQRQLAAAKSGDVLLRPYLTDLCDSIGASMIYDAEQLKLTAIVDESITTSEASVSLGLIVTELVINALKHAFPDNRPGCTIVVEYWSRPTGWRLTVEDNGVGMPADADGHKPGLGTGIVDALSKQLEATVTVSDTNPGTRVAVVHLATATVPPAGRSL